MLQLETAFKEHQTAMKEYIFTVTKQWQLERAKLLSEIATLQQQYQPKGITDNSKLDTRILQNVQNIRDNSQANRELLEKAVKSMVEFCAKTREKEQDLDPSTFHILTGIVRELSYSQQHIQGQLNAFTDLIAQLENELEKGKKDTENDRRTLSTFLAIKEKKLRQQLGLNNLKPPRSPKAPLRNSIAPKSNSSAEDEIDASESDQNAFGDDRAQTIEFTNPLTLNSGFNEDDLTSTIRNLTDFGGKH